ncbi:MAG: enoyl-CoA hydratase/isomerase family protein [Polyangiaceae bacterium]
MASPLRIERDGGVAIWTIDRPAVRNALDSATFSALAAAIAGAARDLRLRAVVLTGAGSTFVSGGDLAELRSTTTRAGGARLARAGRRVCDGLAKLPVPVIAALPGPAIGGGAELAIACDLRIADPRATLAFKHGRMGVTTAWGLLPKLAGMVGHSAAARLLLLGHRLDAAEALRVGLVDAVAPGGACVAMAIAWAKDAARAAPGAIAGMKELLNDALDVRAPHRARELKWFTSAWQSADHKEAVEAFFAQRDPVWRRRRP